MFSHKNDTIAAIATPLGEGGVAIVRISGPQALDVANALFSSDVKRFATHTAHLGQILDFENRVIDQALCLVMKTPRSYTGDDTVEFHCHGGTFIARKVLQCALQRGARMAEGGEFTFRAFINGKIDLAQAEAVQALIGAKSEQALLHASSHLQGELSAKIHSFQKEMVSMAAIFEAWVDFPDEDLAFTTFSEMCDRLDQLIDQMQRLVASYEEGRRLHEGAMVALVGAPNVGKSSLLNALLDEERAIVTPIAGTTRDFIEAGCMLNGHRLSLIDTAGLRDSDDPIEREGIVRSRKMVTKSDLVLFITDPFTDSRALLQTCDRQKTVVVLNKVDLCENISSFDADICISAKEKRGLDQLRELIDQKITQGVRAFEGLILTSERHRSLLQQAQEHLSSVLQQLKKQPSPELIAFEMRQALKTIGQMLGFDVTEEILSSIFSQFCIGK